MGSCFRFIASAVLAASPVAASAQTASVLPRSWALAQLGDAIGEPPRPAEPDFSKTIEARKSYWIPAAEIFAFDFLLNRFDQAYYGCCEFDVTSRTIRRNLRSSWVVDRDPFTFTRAGDPWVPYQWLGEVAMSAVHRVGGLDSLLVCATAILAALFSWLGTT